MIDFTRQAKSIWNSVGKKTTATAVAYQCTAKVEKLCQKYGVAPKYEQRLVNNCYTMTEKVVYAKLSGNSIDTKKLISFVEGELTDSILAASCSSKKSKDFMDDVISLIESSYYESFIEILGNAGYGKVISSFESIKAKLLRAQAEVSNKALSVSDDKEIKNISKGDQFCRKENKEDFHVHKNNKVPKVHENMTDEEEDQFISDLATSFTGKTLATPKEVLDTIKQLVLATNETIKFCEIQETKRTAIREAAAVQIHQIDAMKECIQSYLDKTFDERREIFKKEFDVLNKALDTGNMDVMALTLNHITSLAKESPFKNLSDVSYVQHQLLEKGASFDI